jgi:hypothetical protein
VVDFRNIYDMKEFGYPVCMDCTHSVQRPGGAGGKTGGDRKFVPYMAHAARAFGASGYFIETHPDPDHALERWPKYALSERSGRADQIADQLNLIPHVIARNEAISSGSRIEGKECFNNLSYSLMLSQDSLKYIECFIAHQLYKWHFALVHGQFQFIINKMIVKAYIGGILFGIGVIYLECVPSI